MQDITHENIVKAGKQSCNNLDEHDKDTLLKLYEFMLKLRLFEEEIIKEYRVENAMKCPVHLCIGQEAVPAALSLSLKNNDYLLGTHRSHGYFLSKNAPLKSLIAEIYGKQTGSNGGIGGSQEASYPENNVYNGAILAGGIGIAVGIGLGMKLKKQNDVCVTVFGDGAADEGIIWESLNYSQLCKLPIIFLCENNNYSTFSPQKKRHAVDKLYEKVKSFGVKVFTVFGNDALTLLKTMNEALEYARSGKGPVFIETFTYRYNAHVGPESDDHVDYRSDEEINFWKEHCPIKLLEECATKKGWINSDLKKIITSKVMKEIKEAFEFAKSSPFPKPLDWKDHNYLSSSPLAEKLLDDEKGVQDFDQTQDETTPEPY